MGIWAYGRMCAYVRMYSLTNVLLRVRYLGVYQPMMGATQGGVSGGCTAICLAKPQYAAQMLLRKRNACHYCGQQVEPGDAMMDPGRATREPQ
jgi:hypothetical protein